MQSNEVCCHVSHVSSCDTTHHAEVWFVQHGQALMQQSLDGILQQWQGPLDTCLHTARSSPVVRPIAQMLPVCCKL